MSIQDKLSIRIKKKAEDIERFREEEKSKTFRNENKTNVFSVKLHLDLKFWSNQNKVKFIFISHLDKCCMDKCHSETYPLILILLVRSMRQKYIWSKQCWSNNIEAKKKHLVPKNFSKIIFFSTKKFFNPKFLWTQKFFRTQNRF